MRYLSLFSGIGGFELGIQRAHDNRPNLRNGETGIRGNSTDTAEQQDGVTCIGYSEIDKYAISIYQKHFPNHRNFGSIRDIIAEELPDFDLLCGGFPCQSFSIAGKRGGFEDTRGTLFFDIARIAKVKRPRLLWLENVKGLLSHDDGRTINTIINTLDELGYDVQWQVLNSKHFGVPQNRERIFIIGHLRGTPRPKVFPFGEDSEADIVLPTLTTRYYGGQANGGYIGNRTQQLNQPTHSNNRIYGDEGISPALNTMQGGNRQPKILSSTQSHATIMENQSSALTEAMGKGGGHIPMVLNPKVAIPVLTPDRPEKRQNGRRFKEDGDESFTLTAQDKHGVYDGMAIRRLTPVECCRLQGFPDDWCDGISDSQKYKCLGNAVTVNVIEAIAKKLL